MSTGDERAPVHQEIPKFPRATCVKCGMQACAPIVVDGACTNARACQLRVDRAAAARAMRKEQP